jgi:hypothetical protein
MRRLFLACVVAVLIAVPPSIAATPTSPTLTPSCTSCTVGASTYVTVTSTGLKNGTNYFADAIGTDSSGVDFFWQNTGNFYPVNGSATLQIGPVAQPGTYTVSLYTNQGRGAIKLVAQTHFTAS